MQIQHRSIADFSFFAATDRAYAAGDARLQPFFQGQYNKADFAQAIADCQARYGAAQRQALVQTLRQQYQGAEPAVLAQLDQLEQAHCFTVTTAHQPCLFGGPLYFLTKLVDTVVLARQLKAWFPDAHFVPLFWLGGEDHDFAEVNHLSLFQKTITWTDEQGGSVGAYRTDSLQGPLDELAAVLGQSEAAQAVMQIFRTCYAPGQSFNEATAKLLYHFLAKEGILVLDPNVPLLKAQMRDIFAEELLEQRSQKLVHEQIERLEALGFKAQARPRSINLFYLSPNKRERIVATAQGFETVDGLRHWTKAEILAELQAEPQHFSPNVVLRPVMQEWVLPNLAYVGGGGELAYWLERRSLFEHYGLRLPILLRRSSYLLLPPTIQQRLNKLGLSWETILHEGYAQACERWLRQQPEQLPDLQDEAQQVKALFQALAQKISKIEPSLEKTVLAQQTQLLHTFEKWEERLVRELKRQHDTALGQLQQVYEKIFPGGGLQERKENFLSFYLQNPNTFWTSLFEGAKPGHLAICYL
jgi:bacillithiol biosynthesis cysteine-adding enzyme BshC